MKGKRFVFMVIMGWVVTVAGPFRAFGKENLKLEVTDAVCCYAFNPNPPHEVRSLFVGDTVPADWHLYLPDATSKITIAEKTEELEVVLAEPGVYQTTGSRVQLPRLMRNLLRRKAESCQLVRLDAAGMEKEIKSYTGPLELDDPQRVPSPAA